MRQGKWGQAGFGGGQVIAGVFWTSIARQGRDCAVAYLADASIVLVGDIDDTVAGDSDSRRLGQTRARRRTVVAAETVGAVSRHRCYDSRGIDHPDEIAVHIRDVQIARLIDP